MAQRRYASLVATAISDYIVRPLRKTLGLRNYPTQLNYPVTGFCNSRCVMCNVWKADPQRELELTADQLFEILSDPLYSRVQHWGLSGGEPTLRKDLVDLVKAGLRALPQLKTITISTHGFHTERIKETGKVIDQLCKERGIRFRFSISLDGVGAVHDRVRGVHGVFKKTLETILWIRDETDIDLVIGATLSSFNIDHAFELLYFCVRNKIPYNFRVATSIERLNNVDLSGSITMKGNQPYLLAEFLENIAHNPHSSLERRMFYRNTRTMLTDGVAKTAQCRFKDEGIYLDEQGQLHHCAVFGRSIGNARSESSTKLFFSRGADTLKKEMWEEACKRCIHDYRTWLPPGELVRYAFEKAKVYKAVKVGAGLAKVIALRESPGGPLTVKKQDPIVYITGWYGTETAGDKAILGSLFSTVRKHSPRASFLVGSSNPFYTRQTLRELGADGFAKVIPATTQDEISAGVERADAVMIGGGPLMDLPEMYDVLHAFRVAKRKEIPRAIFGCGVGPVNLLRTRMAVKGIGRLATTIAVRDLKSKEALIKLSGISADRISVAADPAVLYVGERARQNVVNPHPRLGVSIRSLPKHYVGNMTTAEIQNRSSEIVKAYARALDQFIERYDAVVRFVPMNTFYIGDDDRWIQSDIYEAMTRKDRVERNLTSYSAEDIITLINNCDMFLGMRFHSVVFATLLGIPTAAVEYNVHGGKVASFMDAHARANSVLRIQDVTEGALTALVDRLVKDREALSIHLADGRESIMTHARTVYDAVVSEAFAQINDDEQQR